MMTTTTTMMKMMMSMTEDGQSGVRAVRRVAPANALEVVLHACRQLAGLHVVKMSLKSHCANCHCAHVRYFSIIFADFFAFLATVVTPVK